MRIYLVGPSLNLRGGIVSVVLELRKYLEIHGDSVCFFSTITGGGIFRDCISFAHTFFKIALACAFRRADVIHLHSASRGSFLRKSVLAFICQIFRTPYIFHIHGAEFQQFYSSELGTIGRAWARYILGHAACVIALSNAWKDWLTTTVRLKNVAVIFNGVPFFPTIQKHQITPTILFLGRLGKRKGVDDLISAMRQVGDSFPDAVLELGGDGELDKYRILASDLPNVHFLGWVNEAGRTAALNRATVYCLPSWNEGLPMSVLEAMSAGLPVVATPVGGIPEAVVNEVNGLLIQPGDTNNLAKALCSLLGDPDRAETMGRLGKQRHRQMFSGESMGKNCREIYISCTK